MADTAQPHSAAYMGPQRDLFWNLDQVELIAGRLDLKRVRSVLDVGCGQGHWGRLLDRVTARGATTVGVDKEARWVAEAARQAETAGAGSRFCYRLGEANALDLPDASFDLVTCQTLLIHVPDPAAVIAEMVRVTKPGGLVLAAEPNNRAGLMVASPPAEEFGSDAALRRVRFALICDRGKIALGQGDNSIGDRVPGLFAQAGLTAIHVWLADKAWPLVPPYATEEQRMIRSVLLQDSRNGTWRGLTEEQTRALFRAGGGADNDFAAGWSERLREVWHVSEALEAGTLHTAGGGIHYLVAGQCPDSSTAGARSALH
jgi:SAM-dependent methyltransferase